MIRLKVPDLGEKEFQAVKEILKSGYLVQAEEVAQFESLVAYYVGTKYGVAVSSGTAALHLSLLALGIGPGDEVIVPDYTFPATANVVELCGASPILIDIDIETYNINPAKIKEFIDQNCDYNKQKGVINKETRGIVKAIMPVHLFGQPADMDPIKEIADKYNLKIIEDAACALGAEYKGRKCGNLAHIGCFSFHPRKIITTGEGGMLVTNNKKIAERVRSLRNHGITKKKNGYSFEYAGFNYRMTDFQGAIGTVQMRRLEGAITKRVKLVKIYDELLEGLSWIKTPQTISKASHIYQAYVILLDDGIDRDAFMGELKKRGVETAIGTYGLHMLRYYRDKYGYRPDNFPNAKRAFEQAVALPLYSRMSEKDVKVAVEALVSLGRRE